MVGEPRTPHSIGWCLSHISDPAEIWLPTSMPQNGHVVPHLPWLRCRPAGARGGTASYSCFQMSTHPCFLAQSRMARRTSRIC
jgi:hypothetical protein